MTAVIFVKSFHFWEENRVVLGGIPVIFGEMVSECFPPE